MVRLSLPLVALASFVASSSSPASRVGAASLSPRAPITRCGTTAALPDDVEAEAQRVIADAEASRAASNVTAQAAQAVTVPVAFHVITSDGNTGRLTSAQVNSQLSKLNSDYAGAGMPYRFSLASTDYTTNPDWFANAFDGTQAETDMKNALRKGGAETLNLYSVDLSAQSLLGYATFPSSYASAPKKDGVVFEYRSIPGGALAPYNLGATVSHETGHWLSLYHPFQGGCAEPGDMVADTPQQASPTTGCPASRDSCPGGGVDLVHNLMDYSDDSCLNSFTAGQIARATALTKQYRGL